MVNSNNYIVNFFRKYFFSIGFVIKIYIKKIEFFSDN